MKINHVGVSGIPQAMYGMRHPLQSYDKSDTVIEMIEMFDYPYCGEYDLHNVSLYDYINGNYIKDRKEFLGYNVGKNDKKLAINLTKSGSDHRKFNRQIITHWDITAPMTWWYQLDTYKVATVRNSTSRMHRLMARPLTKDDFSWDYSINDTRKDLIIEDLNNDINHYKEMSKEVRNSEFGKKLWRDIIDTLPSSYLMTSMWSASYETLRNIYHNRKGHKQVEFDQMRKEMEALPLSELITTTDARQDRIVKLGSEIIDMEERFL